MNNAALVHDQMHRAFWGEAWHGPALNETLEGVNARKAVAKPLKKAHSIWEIVLHLTTWEEVVRRRVEGENVPSSEAVDWPKIASRSEKAWNETLVKLRSTHENLESTVQKLTDDKLSETVTGGKSTIYFQLHGVIQHALYHAGQIAILKK